MRAGRPPQQHVGQWRSHAWTPASTPIITPCAALGSAWSISGPHLRKASAHTRREARRAPFSIACSSMPPLPPARRPLPGRAGRSLPRSPLLCQLVSHHLAHGFVELENLQQAKHVFLTTHGPSLPITLVRFAIIALIQSCIEWPVGVEGKGAERYVGRLTNSCTRARGRSTALAMAGTEARDAM